MLICDVILHFWGPRVKRNKNATYTGPRNSALLSSQIPQILWDDEKRRGFLRHYSPWAVVWTPRSDSKVAKIYGPGDRVQNCPGSIDPQFQLHTQRKVFFFKLSNIFVPATTETLNKNFLLSYKRSETHVSVSVALRWMQAPCKSGVLRTSCWNSSLWWTFPIARTWCIVSQKIKWTSLFLCGHDFETFNESPGPC